jgi:hypothetical protein
VIAIAEHLVGIVSGTGGHASTLDPDDVVEAIARGKVGNPTFAELAAKLGVSGREVLDLIIPRVESGDLEVWESAGSFRDDGAGPTVTLSATTAGRLGIELVDVDRKGRAVPWHWARAGASRRRGAPLATILTDSDGEDLPNFGEGLAGAAKDRRRGPLGLLVEVERREEEVILADGEWRLLTRGWSARKLGRYPGARDRPEYEPRPIFLLGLNTPHWPLSPLEPDGRGLGRCPACLGVRRGPPWTCLACDDKAAGLATHEPQPAPEPRRRAETAGRSLAGSIGRKSRHEAPGAGNGLAGGVGPVRGRVGKALA